MYPELEQYLDVNKKLTVQLVKALYGCIESGKIWYETLSEALYEIGYIANDYDNCVFNKWHIDFNVQSTIVVHVDDDLFNRKNL
jgi:hypothetical protein